MFRFVISTEWISLSTAIILEGNKYIMGIELIDTIGWIATFFVIVSFLIDNILWLRVVNLIGASLWLAYGIVDLSYSIIFLNVVIVSIQIFKIIFILSRKKN